MTPDTPDFDTSGIGDDPIVVPASPLREQLLTAVRQILPAAAAFAVGRHWLADDTATLLAVIGTAAWAIIDGQRRTLSRSKKLIRLASAAPDSVAVLK